MLIIDKKEALHQEVSLRRNSGLKIGFVPTMGALHQGHLSLAERASKECDIVVVSIFVNPTQFNNPDDLKNYPRDLKGDVVMLQKVGVNLVFAPMVDEMYPSGQKEAPLPVDLGNLETIMEGKHRPGHFKGVVQVVAKLFEMVQADVAYFGQKDFQQLSVIRKMTLQLGFNIKIVGCPTVREPNGLAMSSRNLLLSAEEREEAAAISKALFFVRDNRNRFSPPELEKLALQQIEKSGRMKVEYLEIADAVNLERAVSWTSDKPLRCFTAVQFGKVRLIDNVPLSEKDV